MGHIEALTPGSFAAELRDTLLCFVLVGPGSAHAFCSRYDFGPWPLLPGVAALPPAVLQVSLNTRRYMTARCSRASVDLPCSTQTFTHWCPAC